VTILSASFAGIATLLVAIGLYSVMAYNVAQRTRELGLRLALGAEPASLRSMVLREGGRMAAIGTVIGLVIAIVLAHAAEALLYGLSSLDPIVLVGASARNCRARREPLARASGLAHCADGRFALSVDVPVRAFSAL
jgi:ABC-type antimicrobial peptide transport system permease subunit